MMLKGLSEKGVVLSADSCDYDVVKDLAAQDATTNPSLLLQVVRKEEYQPSLRILANQVRASGGDAVKFFEQLFLYFGGKLMSTITGYVSIQIEPTFAFDIHGSVARAREVIQLFESQGYDRRRILIKMPATWAGCQACKILYEDYEIRSNLTLVFGFEQAIAAAQHLAFVISPFVGRITDWSMKNEGYKGDAGVEFVGRLWREFHAHLYTTQILAASIRTVEQAVALAGCHRLTMPPVVLTNLTSLESERCDETICKPLEQNTTIRQMVTHSEFESSIWTHARTRELLGEGIVKFQQDHASLIVILSEMLLKSATV